MLPAHVASTITPCGCLSSSQTLRSCALRKLKAEVGIAAAAKDMVIGGVNEEIFPDSAFEGINSHCVNTVYGYVVPDDTEVYGRDGQHSQQRWFKADDSSLHPLIKTKVSYFIDIGWQRTERTI